ncbi:hypothetical protein [Piscinibacter sp. HJYY11]|uniref:hypothetical protein n=1 Tax=Piscinibacter sp. HJYY11 TaxID=2801333 RepID=UPI0019202452|nr:hypothetical protein [Piscinibacter sp. HJYY11]MBL0729278.1 hypothetical protein [Piscinibacter sp. HJYY11]
MKRSWVPLLASASLLAACQGVPVDFSGSTVTDRTQIDPYKGQRISAEASGMQVALFLPINVNDRQQRAFADLRRQAGDRLLTDIVVTETWRWAFIGTVYTTRLDATAYPRKPAEPAK